MATTLRPDGRPLVSQRSDMRTRRSRSVSSSVDEIIEETTRDAEGRSVRNQYVKGKLLGKVTQSACMYEDVISLCCEGGFAHCYVGTLLPHRTQYALKVVAKSTLTKPRAQQKFNSEIRIHRHLRHSNVVRFDRYFEDHQNAYILLELCKNNSMSELMKRRKRLTEPEVRYYALQLVSALCYLHEGHIIHRDLKLGNIFLDSHMRVKLGDFGLATKLAHPDERKRTVCGTPNYIAPEILQGNHEHSFEVDIWSTGIIIYTLLVGKPPYESKDVQSTYRRILDNSYSFPSHCEVSDHARDLVRCILQSLPERRPSLAAIESHPFFTSAGVHTPTALSSVTMREPPTFIHEQKTAVSGGYTAAHAPLSGNDENDPGVLNRGRGVARAEKRFAGASHTVAVSPPRKILSSRGNTDDLGEQRPSRRVRAASSARAMPTRPSSGVGRSESATRVRKTTSSGSTGNNCATGEGYLQTAVTNRGVLTQQNNAQPIQHADMRGYARQFEVYNEIKSKADVANAKDNKAEIRQSEVLINSDKDNQKIDIYVETISQKKNIVDGVNQIQISLENCGIESTDEKESAVPVAKEAWGKNDQAEDVSQPPTFVTPKSNCARPRPDPDTLECMYKNLESSFAHVDEHITTQSTVDTADGPKVWVVRHVDYTAKYGLGFLLNTGSAGVYFNDSTKIVLSPDDNTFQYLERKRRSSSSSSEHISRTYTLQSYPADLNKKVTLLKHFKNYLMDQSEQTGNTATMFSEALRKESQIPTPNAATEVVSGDLPYVKKWVRTRHAILFRLSNRTAQVVFFDQSELILSSEARCITYVNKEGARSSHTPESIRALGRTDIEKRLKYTKDIMARLIVAQPGRDKHQEGVI